MKTGWFRNFLIGLVGAIIIALGFSIFTAATATTTFYYSITDLGTLGGSSSQAYAVNNAGQVVGRADTSSGTYHAFLWTNGTMNDLGSLGGSNSVAYGINNTGQVVGSADTNLTSGTTNSTHAFLWNGNTMTDLGTLGGNISQANTINNRGQVVGRSTISSDDVNNNNYRAFLWKDDTMQNLGTLGGISLAIDINDRGQIVGQTGFSAFLWEKGTMTNIGGGGAAGINNRGQVVGANSTYSSAVLWNNGVIQELGTLTDGNNNQYTSFAYRINNRSQVVGSTYPSSNSLEPYHAFIWVSGVIRDLNSLIPANSGWELNEAQDINNKGQIVGWGSFNGQTHAFLLTPTWVTN